MVVVRTAEGIKRFGHQLRDTPKRGEGVTDHLLTASQSPVLGWLTIAFLFTASIGTYFRRILSALPREARSAPSWVGLLLWIEILLKVALVVLNWRFGLLVYVLGYTLALMGLLERVGGILMYPFVRVWVPDDVPRASDYSDCPWVHRMALRTEKTYFISQMLLTVGTYLGLTLLLNAVRGGDASVVFLWAFVIPQLLLYLYIFCLAAARASKCGYRVSWLVGFLAILGRVNNFEVFVIPAVVLASLVVSESSSRTRESTQTISRS